MTRCKACGGAITNRPWSVGVDDTECMCVVADDDEICCDDAKERKMEYGYRGQVLEKTEKGYKVVS